MTVQSARVQQIVKGDDVTMTHQIMEDVAFNAELSRAPVQVDDGDTVSFFYPLQDFDHRDYIGYPGIPVGSYPTSTFTVAIPGDIPGSPGNWQAVPPVPRVPDRGTKTFQEALGQTVRAEITRLRETYTGNVDGTTDVITGLSSTAGLTVGMSVVGPGVQPRSIIAAISGSTITLNQVTTAEGSAVSLAFGVRETHYLIQEVDIFQRGFPSSLDDTTGGRNPPPAPINLT